MITKKDALILYRKLLLARLSEEKIRELYPQNEIKSPVHLGIGEEAIPIGVNYLLPKETQFFGTYRNHALYLTLTEDTDSFFAELYGKVTGAAKGKGGSMHFMAPKHGLMATSAVVGTTIPLAVGAAFANHYRQSQNWVVVFFGDGALEEGVFWESLNFACLHKLRILFVCEDNSLAIHSHPQNRRGFRSILEAVGGFECHTASENGSDLIKVLESVQKVMDGMLGDPKPGVLHLTYFRYLEHVGPNEDFEAGYRQRPSSEEMQKMDPLANFIPYLHSLKFSIDEIRAIEINVKEQINQSVRKAQTAPFSSPDELCADLLI